MAPTHLDGLSTHTGDSTLERAPLRAILVAAAAVATFSGADDALGHPCAQPVSDGPEPVATDCVAILNSAVRTSPCAQPCACDVDGNGATTALDGLYCLRRAVGEEVALECSRCNPRWPTAFAVVFVDLAVPWLDGYLCWDCPVRLFTHISLDVDGTGSVSFARDDLIVAPIATTTPVVWSLEGEIVSIAPWQAEVFPGGTLRWQDFRLALHDRDGDYVLDEGAGHLYANFEQFLGGDVLDGHTIDGDFATDVDSLAPTLALYRPRLQLARETFPSEAPLLVASEPLLVEEIASGVRLLIDGAPVDSTIEVVSGSGPLMTQARIRPSQFPPFAATIEIDPGPLTDLVGYAAVWSGDPLTTAADPGSAATNLGFENTGGWSGLESCGSFGVIAPTQGSRQACLLDWGELIGYVDLPPDAGELIVSVGVLAAEPYSIDTDHVTVRITHPTRTIEAFNALVPPEQLQPYECGSNDPRECLWIPPYDLVVDVADFAGDRIFLHAEVRSVPPFTWYALFLDDVRIR